MRQLFQNIPAFLAFQFSSIDGSIELTLDGMDSVKICRNWSIVSASEIDEKFWDSGIFHEENFSPDIPSIIAVSRQLFIGYSEQDPSKQINEAVGMGDHIADVSSLQANIAYRKCVVVNKTTRL